MLCKKYDYLQIKPSGQILCGQMVCMYFKIGGNMRLKLYDVVNWKLLLTVFFFFLLIFCSLKACKREHSLIVET